MMTRETNTKTRRTDDMFSFPRDIYARTEQPAIYEIKSEGVPPVNVWHIKYKTDGELAVTKCPRRQEDNVGSFGCMVCPKHIENNRPTKIVRCADGN